MLLRRRYDKEIMDDRSITDERIVRALDELRVINTWLGGKSASAEGIAALARGDGTRLTVLDVGSGGSDALERLRHSGTCAIISMDINAGVCRYVRERAPDAAVVCGDALALPVRPACVDIVHVSLFLHHFAEADIERLLSAFLDAARIGVVVNDLRRSVPAYAGIWLLTRIFRASPMVRHDGPLSVRRGFSRRDLEPIMRRLPAAAYAIHRRWAFRWLIVLKK